MKNTENKKLYFPALAIVIVIFVLLLFIGVSTYQNLDNNRRHVMSFVHRQGGIILHSIEAGVRAGMMSHTQHEDSIGKLIVETGKNEDISYIYLADSNKKIQYHSNQSLNGTMLGKFPKSNVSELTGQMKNLADNTPVYEVIKKFNPFPQETHLPCSGHLDIDCGHKVLEIFNNEAILVIGMKMRAFETARDADIHHAYVMVGILISLGAGTFFFIFVIRNYYTVNTTLIQNQNYTHQVIASMANGLLSIDTQGKIITCNCLASELLGLKQEKIISMEIREIINLDYDGIYEAIMNCGSIIDKEVQHRLPDNNIIPLAVSVTPIPDEKDLCCGMVIIIRDLREIKNLEDKVRKTEKLAALGKLAASVAHEIRNPLSSIRGFAQFLSHILKESPENQEYAKIMVKEVDRINRVVTDLLTFAKPIKPKRVLSDISRIVEHTIRLMEQDSRAAGINIIKNIPENIGEIYVDPNQITQVILNLILNALHELESGGIIEIGAGQDKQNFLLWVNDNGPGIPEENIQKIFDPFYTTREKGTGLGLAIVQKIAESHDGTISVQSPPEGKVCGCCIFIRIPFKS